jgi:uncharacterized protein (DUF58 family)
MNPTRHSATDVIWALRAAILHDVRTHRLEHEFYEARPYATGDDYRKIDWNATARMGELYTRTSQKEKTLTLAAIIDTSASMRVGIRRSLSAAAEESRKIWRRVALPEDRYIHIPEGNGIVERDVASALAFANAKLPKGAALLVISDCYGFSRPLLVPSIKEAGRRFACTLLLARDPWYHEIPLRGSHRIRDIETGTSRQIFFGSRERARYHQALRDRENTIRENFAAAGWRTGILTEDSGTDALLATFLRRNA